MLILDDALNCQSRNHQPRSHHICFLVIFAVVFGAHGCVSSVQRSLCPVLTVQVRARQFLWHGTPARLYYWLQNTGLLWLPRELPALHPALVTGYSHPLCSCLGASCS